jgi:hypothetical protein
MEVNMKQKAATFLLVVVIFSACRAQATSIPATDEIHPELQNIPAYPESSAWMEGIPGVNQYPYKYPVYSYTVKTTQYKHIIEFYEEEMPANNWELLSRSIDSKTQSAGLIFAKPKAVAHVQIYPRIMGVYVVYVVFYDDPVSEE